MSVWYSNVQIDLTPPSARCDSLDAGRDVTDRCVCCTMYAVERQKKFFNKKYFQFCKQITLILETHLIFRQ